MSVLIGKNGQKNVKEIYIGVNGNVRKVKEGYVEVGGVPKLFYSYTKTLNDYSWEEISAISEAGLGPGIFKIGDTKLVHVQGTVGETSFNDDYLVYIIDFSHDGGNTIEFGAFRNLKGQDICLVGANYDSFSNKGNYFNMNNSLYNTGGWKACKCRYSILGSTKIENADAPADTATSPLQNTLMAALPFDLRSVMKPITVWTDNTGGGSNIEQNVTSTIDYLPLLSPFEVLGAINEPNQYEPSKQKRYTYYTQGGSIAKYKSSGSGLGDWFLRSPAVVNPRYFCCINSQYEDEGSQSPNTILTLEPILRV